MTVSKATGIFYKNKRVKATIISIILGIAVISGFFSSGIAGLTNVYGDYQKKTATVILDSGTLNVRSGPGTGYEKVGSLNNGVSVTITGEGQAADGALWYQIESAGLVGYVHSSFIGNIKDIVQYEPDADFEAYLSAQGFPESYKDSLRKLHQKYPKWVFVADNLNVQWDDAINAESRIGTNLVSGNSMSSWKSIEDGAYDWDNSKWYTFDSGNWVAASREMISYCMDPRNFLDEPYIWMFESVSYNPAIHTKDNLENILNGTFMASSNGSIIYNEATKRNETYADILMDAASKSGVSPYHLAASIIQEMGRNGSSGSISGTYTGYAGYYNYYNWNAYAKDGKSAIENGLIYAMGESQSELRPWNSRYKAIVGGAIKLGSGYINRGQDTLYYKKFNLVSGNLASHQYMTNVQAPISEAAITSKAYSDTVKSNTALVFKIPVLKNMPQQPCAIPKGDGSPNNCLKSLSVDGQTLTPTFSKFQTEYSINVPNSVSSVNVKATAIDSGAVVSGCGIKNLSAGANVIEINVKAQNGQIRKYAVTIVRENTGGGTDKPEIKNPSISPADKSGMVVDGNGRFISGITPGMTVENFITSITVKDGTIAVFDRTGKQMNGGKITTGCTVAVKNSQGTIVENYQTVIYGDINGDGTIDIKDALTVRKYLIGQMSLDGVYAKAANVNKDQAGIDIKDALTIRKFLLGQITIEQR